MLTEPSLKNLTKSNFGKPPDKQNELLQELGKPHVQSFNYFLRTGLDLAVADLNPVEFELLNKSRIRVTIESAHISPPSVPLGVIGIRNQSIFPTECRQKHDTYRGKLTITIGWSIDGVKQPSVEKDMGNIPIMLKSDACHLSKMTPAQLIEHNEHPEEWGGYFVVKGLEKLVRMLLLSRRNYPFTITRPTWKQRGVNFSDLGVQIRCVKRDQTTVSNVIHYLTNGTAKFMFSYQKNLFYLPVMLLLKSLQNYSDKRIYETLVGHNSQNTHFGVCVENMLRALHTEGLHTQEDCKSYLGKMFKVKFWEVPQWASDIRVTEFILRRCILIHLDSDEDKFNLLVFMLQKLFSLVNNECIAEGSDSIMMQEILLGGHLYLQIVKEKLTAWMYNLRAMIFKRMKNSLIYKLSQTEFVNAAKYAGGLQNILESFLSTGNLSSHSGLGLMQDKGLTIVAENINRMRYMSHFKSVHRGSFFVEMRTTEVRQLLPDAWGFICPVHTPDGAPCGLLNHLTMDCQITDVADEDKIANIAPILTSLGMIPLGFISTHDPKKCYVTLLNGKVIGYIPDEIIGRVVDKLRAQKIEGEKIPKTTELGLIPKRNVPGQYPGLFIFTGPARMMRPVINLALKKIELIGTLEQVYLDVCIIPEESYKGLTSHMEISECSFMSNLAQLIPMPDCNQSPRNMYQCQMGKQTMGTPCHNWGTVGDTKLYRLETPASPFFRPLHYDNIELDNFAMGVNAYVAVISYTGYDMEDAMIINKASYERGLAHGCIYKTEFIDLPDVKSYFCRDPEDETLSESIDNDGLPHPSNKIKLNDPFYCYFDANANKYVVKRYHEKEEVVVDSVRICGNLSQYTPKRAAITYRIIRNPSVGDKFASRAGQKGICSKLWPSEDLPFSETGLIPDIVFNPHGFPSRMTIAMMIEVLAGKSAVLHGLVHDATPFRFNEDNTAIDYFGKLLEAAGYNYYGTEPMYSGVDGRELKAHIFTGIVHYQRLRHMVSDKWQVRRTGPVDAITRQPVKGRKQGGGVRFGEMERDALISHGATFLLQDRLFNCSDKSIQQICRTCGSLLGAISITTRRADKPFLSEVRNTCKLCKEKSEIVDVEIPYVFKYFAMELASVNIHIKLQLKHV